VVEKEYRWTPEEYLGEEPTSMGGGSKNIEEGGKKTATQVGDEVEARIANTRASNYSCNRLGASGFHEADSAWAIEREKGFFKVEE